jgi:hypothetical protein
MLLGLTGDAYAGKDTAYRIIKETYPQAVNLKLAGPLKQAVAALLGTTVGRIEELKTHEHLWLEFGGTNPPLDIKPLTIRTLLQRMGSEVGRDLFGEDFWVDQLLPHPEPGTLAKPKGVPQTGEGPFVITDVRFTNEAQRIRDLGGYVFKIVRTGEPVELGAELKGHRSEEGVPPSLIDATIPNPTGRLEEFKDNLLFWVERTMRWQKRTESRTERMTPPAK